MLHRCCSSLRGRLLWDARVVDVLRLSKLLLVTLSSLQPFLFSVALKKRGPSRTRSYWIPGSFETSSSMSAPSNALPRFRTL